jgi:hypothetical protein
MQHVTTKHAWLEQHYGFIELALLLPGYTDASAY